MSELLVRATEPQTQHGPAPHERSVEDLLRVGCVYLDKPLGPTTHQAVAWLRDAVGARKVAHAGTLDPHVSGLVVCTLDRATKTIGTLRGADKTYVAVMELHESVPIAEVRDALARFVGPIHQLPPGKAAVRRRLRTRRVNALRVIEAEPGDEVRRVLFEVRCQAGTYVRKLCIDAGLAMGVRAHMAALRRTGTGAVTEDDAVTLHDVKDAYDHWRENGDDAWLREVVHPVEDLLATVPSIVVRSSAVDALCHGAPLHVPGVLAVDERVRAGSRVVMLTQAGQAVAVGEARLASKELVEATKGVAVAPDSVIMEPGTYPRQW